MDCETIAELLATGGLADLTSDQRTAVAEHVWECAACRRKWGLDLSVGSPEAEALGARDAAAAGGGAILSHPGGGEKHTPDAGEAWPPRDLGGFEILGRVGHGGMGSVFRARQPSVERIVALKVLPMGAAWDGAAVVRFAREARSAAAAGHPNIIGVYDVGQDRGWHYIAMEYVDGGSLDDAIRRDGPLSPVRALELMKQVAAGLAEAHRIGIIHRDIKPSNILLTSTGWAKLADFGLAKRPAVDLSVTRTEATLGTPAYMAPEVLRGESPDARSDLYSLGATFYHALAGRPPFTGSSDSELVARHLETPPAPLADLAPDVPGPLARIIHRLLAKEPADRCPSARELLVALGGVRAPAVLRPMRGLRRLGRALPGKPWAWVAAGLLFLATIGTLVGLWAWPNGTRSSSGVEASLFDGKTLNGWRVIERFPGSGAPGQVRVRDGQIILGAGSSFTGIAWAAEFPTADYEVVIEANRLGGSQDFCSMTFPVGASRCTLLVGAGTNMVRLKRVDGNYVEGVSPPGGFRTDQWYRVSLRVTGSHVEVMIDQQNAIMLPRKGHEFTAAPAFDLVKPFGLNSYETSAAIRRIELRRLSPEPE